MDLSRFALNAVKKTARPSRTSVNAAAAVRAKQRFPPSIPLEIDSAAHSKALIANCPVPVLVDFSAQWCGPCRMVAPEMERSQILKPVDFWWLNKYGNSSGVVEPFRDRSIPTMMVFFTEKKADGQPGLARLERFKTLSCSRSAHNNDNEV